MSLLNNTRKTESAPRPFALLTSADKTRYWKSLQEFADQEAFQAEAETEFAQTPLQIEADPSRRAFLKASGFTFAGAILTGCSQAPVHKAVPNLAQPEEMVPGRSLYYASTCNGCNASCGLLMKTRDGRPIKLEGNPLHPLSRGGLCAAGQASLLGLYDSHRLHHPLVRGMQATWEDADRAIGSQLETIRREGGPVRFWSTTVTSPAREAVIRRFLAQFKDGQLVEHDPLSSSAILDAHMLTHGARVLPGFHFEKAFVVASFDADFLGTWISPVQFSRAYMEARNPEMQKEAFSFHAQFESRLSLTGCKADSRTVVAPEQLRPWIAQLAALLSKKAGAVLPGPALPPPAHSMDALAEKLWTARGKSLVVCGLQDVHAQVLVNFINHTLGNYGTTLDLAHPSHQHRGSDAALQTLLEEIRSGKIAALFLHGVNPLAQMPRANELSVALKKLPLVVSFAERQDETAGAAHYVCPDHHPLESWSDAEPVSGAVSLSQPAIRPLAGTRPVVESLSTWSGLRVSAYEIVRRHWKEQVFPRQNAEPSFDVFWNKALHDGVAAVTARPAGARPFDSTPVAAALSQPVAGGGEFSLVLYPKVSMLDGRHAYNPWLHELPDPVSKAAWDNYACLSPAAAARLSLKEGDVVRVDAGADGSLDLPVLLQPGQHDNVVAVALGYGRKDSARFAEAGPRWLNWRKPVGENGLVGTNAAPLLRWQDRSLTYTRSAVRLTKTSRTHPLAITQSHHSLTVPKNLAPSSGSTRPIIQEAVLPAYLKDAAAGASHHEVPSQDLWPRDHANDGHRWAMAVDLNACTGCSACVVACQVENNIPVVGKDEMGRRREMHWIRIDRYYSGPPEDVSVAHQPMMCQQCEHAPCETVCPVLATVHSAEGLNQQIYNRCVGTRYCANNCPYKARRFNWFDYPHEDRLANLVLNPDVTVRSRGVMEKCTFCVQRIQEARIEAGNRGAPIADGVIQTACQQSCPTHAIVFGDIHDPGSRVSQLSRQGRAYRVLEEINVRPSVNYLRLVRNRPEKKSEGENHG
ncbi:MAG: TAT-variant-translocated molybdopterin oxidoreductase [Acidobacteriia bacterium]|nr:TAT-variant-translocated molybdopterin oxidoreductase [Terriglobia bacterium]